MKTPLEISQSLSYEQLAAALYMKGESDGYHKVTDKTKWREPVMAEKLNHVAHEKISAGAGKDEYGSDAYDSETGMYAEYKSQAIVDKQLNNLFERPLREGNYVPLKIVGVYNGAYKPEAVQAYSEIDHYFGVFYKELCVMIIKPKTEEVISQLESNNSKRKPGSTTNLNSVVIDLAKKSMYNVVYKNEEFFCDG